MAWDPLDDEKKPLTMDAWVAEMNLALAVYEESLNGKNDFTRGEHTFAEWMSHFQRFMSW